MEIESAEGAVATTETTTQNTESQSQQQSHRPAGYDPVDPNTASPEQVQQRIDYLYRQVREGQKETTHYKTMMAQKIDELVGGLGTVVNHIQDKTFADTEASLSAQMKQAFEAGDTAGYLSAQEKLIDIKAEKKFGNLNKKEAPKEQAQQNQNQGDRLSPEDSAVIESWQAETDDSGMPLRPWAINRGSEGRPDTQYLAALAEANAVMNSPRFANLSMADKMAEVDRRMGVRPTARQNVMGGGLTNGRKSAKISLSPEAERLAVRMKFGGPNAKSDADHITAYIKAKETSSQKGTRK
jgi:hypothetical protein